MIYETKKYVEILIKHNITPNQFLLAWLVYNKQWDELRLYMEAFGSFSMAEIKDLMNKDIIITLSKNAKQFQASDLIVTELFADEMIIAPEDAWEEFLQAYPGKVKVNGNLFAAKGLTFSDEAACKEKYNRTVNKNKYVHRNILVQVEKWKNDNGGYATMKIDKFVTGEYWKEIETERSGSVGPALY